MTNELRGMLLFVRREIQNYSSGIPGWRNSTDLEPEMT
jgi:hypothetical protein